MAACLGVAAGATASHGCHLPAGLTGKAMHALHREIFWICVGIAAAVFGVMIHSLLTFRRRGDTIPDTSLINSARAEIIWTLIPVLILIVMALPAARVILKQKGIYGAPCAAPGGRNRGDLPMVVGVRTFDDFKTWVDEPTAAANPPALVPAGAPATALRALIPSCR